MFLTNKNKSIIDYLLVFLNILPIILGLVVIFDFSTNVPNDDQWSNDVPHLIKYFEGSFSVEDYLAVHNDHRPLIPRLIYYPIEFFTHGDYQILAFASFFIHTLSFLLVIRIIREYFISSRVFLLSILPLSVFWFNLHIMSNLLSGLSIDHASCVFFAIISSIFFAKSRKIDRFFFISVISASFCMFSFSAGVLIWLAGILVILYQNKQDRLFRGALWLGTAFICIVINYVVLPFPSEGRHGVSGYVLYLSNFFHYFPYKISNIIGSLGSQILGISYSGVFFGILLIILTVSVIALNKKMENEEVDDQTLFLLLFSFLTCVAIAITRSGQGIDFGVIEKWVFNIERRQYPVSFLLIPSLYLFFIKSYISLMGSQKPENENHNVKRGNYGSQDISLAYLLLIGALVGLMLLSSAGNAVYGLDEAFRWKNDHNPTFRSPL